MKKITVIALALVGSTASLRAQSSDQIAAYGAVTRTPVGILGPVLTNTLINRLQNGASLSLRYGSVLQGDLNTTQHGFAATGILPAGLGASVSITGGVIAIDCVNCDRAALMLGVGGDMRLTAKSMGTTSRSPLFTVSLDGELGYGKRATTSSSVSGYVGVPVALVQRGSGMQFVPFLTPGFYFARASTSGIEANGSGTMVGGGLGIYNTLTNVSLNVGAQHFFLHGARNSFGLNLTIGGK